MCLAVLLPLGLAKRTHACYMKGGVCFLYPHASCPCCASRFRQDFLSIHFNFLPSLIQVAAVEQHQSRYANVLDSIEKAHSRLTEIPPNGKDSIRAVFDSAEGLFKLMFPNETRLTGSAVGGSSSR